MDNLKKEIIHILTKCGLSINNSFVSNGHVFTLAETEKGYMLQFSFNTDNEFEFALSKIENCIKKYDCVANKEIIKRNNIKFLIQEV